MSGAGRRSGNARVRRQGGLPGAWLSLVLVLVALPFLAGFGGFRSPGLLPGVGPDETMSVLDLARLRGQPAPPAVTARAALVWDASSGVELYAKALDDRRSPASTTKMLTALLAIELGKLDTRVTIEEGDLSPPDESTMALALGDVVTLEDLLYGMLLPSGGDAARATARTIGAGLLKGARGDPVARFMQEMNARAARLGLVNTHFVNPDGDDAEGQYSTARDLAAIANEALKNPVFAKIVAMETATRQTVDGSHTFSLSNTNHLLGVRAGLHGVKTGTTDAAGQCLVSAQWGPGGRIITVVLGSEGGEPGAIGEGRFVDTAALLDWTNNAYRWTPLGKDGKDGGVPGLATALARWNVGFRETRTVALPAWEAPLLRYRLLLEPGKSEAGKVTFLVGAREVLTLPVYPVEARTAPPGPPATATARP